MRVSALLFVTLTGSLLAGETANPLWDGHESVADYAQRVMVQTYDVTSLLTPGENALGGITPPGNTHAVVVEHPGEL